jgi:hypothetical protein
VTVAKRATPASMSKHVDELYKEGMEAAKRYREIAVINDAFVRGEQWGHVQTKKGKQSVKDDAWFDDEDIPRIAVNETGPSLMTWSALMTKDRPTVKSVPANDSPEAAYKAEIGDKIIEFLEGELDAVNRVHKTVHKAGAHGTAGLKVCYLKEEDKLSWSICSIFDFVIDPRHADYRKARWVIFEDHVDKEEAEELYDGVGIKTEPVVVPYKNAAGDALKGVRKLELWERPSRAHPAGLYVCKVGDEVVEVGDYPLVFEDDSGAAQTPLPLVLMRVRDHDSVYGGTNLTGVVPLQRGFNEMVSRIQADLRLSKRHLLIPDSLPEDFDLTTSSVIRFKATGTGPAAAKAIGWTNPGETPRAFFEQRDFFRSSMQTVMGLNEVTLGAETRSLSGRAIDNMVQLDEQRNADAAKEMQAMVQDAWQLSWQIVARFYTDVRKAKIANAPLADVFAFNSTDVAGMDIRLEPASQLDKLSTVDVLATKERVDQGIDGPTDLARAKSSPAYGTSKQQAELFIQAFLAGQDIELPNDTDPEVMLDVVQRHKTRALSARDMEMWIRLERLRRELAEMNTRMDEASPAPGAEQEA